MKNSKGASNNTSTPKSLWARFIAYCNAIISTGVMPNQSFAQRKRIEMCNFFILICFPFILIHVAYNFFGPNILAGYIVPGTWFCISLIVLILNYFSQHRLARTLIIVIPLFLVAFVHATYGWDMRIEPMYLLLAIMSLYFLPLRSSLFMSVLIISIYVFVFYKIEFIGISPDADIVPSTPFVYFGVSLVITIILTARLILENKKYALLINEQNRSLTFKNKELESFTYIASHDLKSPLRIISSFAGMLKKELKNNPKKEVLEYVDFIGTNAKQMNLLIEDILELAKLDRDELPNLEPVDLHTVVNQVKEILAQEIEEKKAYVNCQNLLTYNCNRVQFLTLFQNLIQNGIKFNEHPSPVVNIWSTEEEGHILLHVQDNGIGIEKEFQDQIFGYFKRLHTSDKYPGTGIGLGLCKKIVEKHDGEIIIQSEHGQGTTFSIKLPKQT